MNIRQQEMFLSTIVKDDSWMMSILELVKTIDKKDVWIGAGFVRNKLWDNLHEFHIRTEFDDIDVIYFESKCIDKKADIEIEKFLKQNAPDINWSVKNQARMHIRNGNDQYRDTSDALSYWTETATCIAVRLNEVHEIEFSAPLGMDDLFNLVVRRNERSSICQSEYITRLDSKKWNKKWPKLKFVG